MANTIKLKRSSTASDAPTASDLEVGELAINTADAKLFTKHTDNSIKEISGSGGGGGDLVDDTTPQLGGDLDTNGNDINFPDSAKATFGNDGDLEILHSGFASQIRDVGNGGLVLQTTNGPFIQLSTDFDILAKFYRNGASEIYHDNSKKLETASTGVSVTGNLDVSDTTTNPELNLYYNKATNTYAEDVGHINFHGIQNDGSSERFAQIAGYAQLTGDTSGYGQILLRCLDEDGTDDGTLVTALKLSSGFSEFSGDVTFNGSIKETAYNLTGTYLDPGNGTVQYKTLTANTTFTEGFNTSESITLMINAAGYTVTWPAITWVGGSAPTLAASGYTTVVLWELHQAGGLFGAVVS